MPSEFEVFELRVLSEAERDPAPSPAETVIVAGHPPETSGRDLVACGTADALVAAWRPSYAVRASSSQGEGRGVFRFPFSTREAIDLVVRGPQLAAEAIDDLGRRLFRAAFAEEIRELFTVTHREAIRTNRKLRLLLVLEPPELAELPWEILRPPDWAFAPALSQREPIVRRIDLLGEHRGVDVGDALEVLLVAALPQDQHQLDLDRERQGILRALEPLQLAGKVRVTDLGRARKAEVLDQLRSGRHHVLHFMMHADINEAQGGVLVLEDEGQGSALLESEELAIALSSNPQAATRLVILNACRTADDGPTRPGRGLAAVAVRLNLPAVVAMQYPISDLAAIEFAHEFYRRLVQGWGVDEAIAWARYAIRFNLRQEEPSREWITPVLYLRSKDTCLFRGTTANALDYTPDAQPAEELSRLVGQVKSLPKTGKSPEELVLSIRRTGGEGGRFDVRLETPEGPAEATIELPEMYTASMRVPDAPGYDQDERYPGDPDQLKRMGSDLFARLFVGDLGAKFRAARARARASRSRLRLSLVADDERMDHVPWEFLLDPSTGLFLTLEGSSQPFLRRIEAPGAVAPEPIDLPLRILFVACNPRDMAPLNLQREWEWLQKAVQGISPDRVRVERLQDPTRGQVFDALNDGGYHVLHFAGYDSFCTSGGCLDEGIVLLDEDAKRDDLPPDQLANLLSGLASLRLVVTNTCQTAARLAPTLVRGGIPGAIGMRFAVLDDVAVQFSLLFYKALLKLDWDVAAALAEARKLLWVKMDRNPRYTGNWTYPTLVTNVPGAAVFGRLPVTTQGG
ncbi:MAG TPA: CHAT domain-containing protein [Isosphaeraceae bacterium]